MNRAPPPQEFSQDWKRQRGMEGQPMGAMGPPVLPNMLPGSEVYPTEAFPADPMQQQMMQQQMQQQMMMGMGGMQGMPMGDMQGMGAMMGGPGYGMGERIFPCVKLRGLPFDITEDDIRLFLECEPVDILMIRRNGRFSGEALVVLGAVMHLEYALSKNRTYLGRRYVEVFRAKKLDYYKAVMAEMMDGDFERRRHDDGPAYDPATGMPYPRGGAATVDGAGTNLLKLRGLPFSANEDDVVKWFDEPSMGIPAVDPKNVQIIYEGGRATGICFVEFPTPQDATAAMGKNKQAMGSRYIEIFPAKRDEIDRYKTRM